MLHFSVKKILATAIILAATAAVQADTVRWWSFNSGLDAARKQKKPIVIDFYADWCHWCKVMEESTFGEKNISRKLNSDYIAVKVDTQKNERITYRGVNYTPLTFAQAVGVDGLPTVLFLDRDGNPITRLGGYIRPHTFIALLDYIKDECYRDHVAFKDYVSGKTSCRPPKK